jgi:hypothetical protein
MPATPASGRTEEQLLALGSLLARSGKTIESEISGTSMGSTLPSGSRIRIQPLPAAEYQAGQIVAFVREDTIFAHRIVYRTRQGVLTRGDTHVLCDFPVAMTAVLGAVTEWSQTGEWHRFVGDEQCSQSMSGRAHAVEALLCACMRIDIRLARFATRALNRLVRLRHRVAVGR